jgi:hypothetical protein
MNDEDWQFISGYLIGNFVFGAIRRHWRLLLAAFIVYLLYRRFVWGI